MPKSPSRVSPKLDMDHMHKVVRYTVSVGILTAFVVSIIFTALAGKLMLDVHDEGSNPRNAGDTSLTDKEQDYQVKSGAAFTAWMFTVLLTLIYIAMRV